MTTGMHNLDPVLICAALAGCSLAAPILPALKYDPDEHQHHSDGVTLVKPVPKVMDMEVVGKDM
jgi:hypothetical protein